MKLPRPLLDDRSAFEMIEQARQRVRDLGGAWSDLSPSDPGQTLIELFAYLTEQLQYRLNRVPELHYIALLDLIGVTVAPPSAAMVELALRREEPATTTPTLPRGSVFTTRGRAGEPVRFTTAQDQLLTAGATAWTVRAYHAELHPPAVVGFGTGLPGLVLRLPRARVPVVAPLRDLPSFRLWVEERGDAEGALSFEGGSFVRWREVESFADTAPTDPVYRLDRAQGTITFAPSAQRLSVDSRTIGLQFAEGTLDGAQIAAALPDEDGAPRAEIKLAAGGQRFSNATTVSMGEGVAVTRVQVEANGGSLLATLRLDPGVQPGWRDVTVSKGSHRWVLGSALRVLPPELESLPVPRGRVPGDGLRVLVESWSGGSSAGNVGALSVTNGPLPEGVTVSNPRPATGGRDGETLANAMERGPQELKELRRVVTAEDYEALVLRTSGSVARAFATAKRDRWVHATPGTVEVSLVPQVPQHARGPLGWVQRDDLSSRSDGEGGSDLERERILRALDARKPLGTRCEVSWCRYKDVTVKARLHLHSGVDPEQARRDVLTDLHLAISPLSWPFERPLLISDVYEVILRNAGVNYVAEASIEIDLSVGEVYDIQPDLHQPNTFFAAADGGIFRSLNRGETWEASHPVSDATGRGVCSSRLQPGWVLAVLERRDDRGRPTSQVLLSQDCGETWSGLMPPEPWQLLSMRLLERRADDLVLVMATSLGLRELAVGAPAASVLVEFSSRNQRIGARPVRALTVGRTAQGEEVLYLSFDDRILCTRDGVFDRSFVTLPDIGRDLVPTCLFVESRRVNGESSPRLWAGLDSGGSRGQGVAFADLNSDGSVSRWTVLGEVRESREDPTPKPWDAGSVYALLQRGSRLLVATHQGGVGTLDLSGPLTAMQLPSPSGGLPVRGLEGRLFEPVASLCARGEEGAIAGVKMGKDSPSRDKLGVYVSDDGVSRWAQRSGAQVQRVDMPSGYLPVSGEHEVTLSQDGPSRGER